MTAPRPRPTVVVLAGSRPASASTLPASTRDLAARLGQVVVAGDDAKAAAVAAFTPLQAAWIHRSERGRIWVELVGRAQVLGELDLEILRLIANLAGLGSKPARAAWTAILAASRARVAMRGICDYYGITEVSYQIACWLLETRRWATKDLGLLAVEVRRSGPTEARRRVRGRWKVTDEALRGHLKDALWVVGTGRWATTAALSADPVEVMLDLPDTPDLPDTLDLPDLGLVWRVIGGLGVVDKVDLDGAQRGSTDLMESVLATVLTAAVTDRAAADALEDLRSLWERMPA